jgi:hypothetical protein
MSNEVYANGMELACKSGEGKSVCAFPDVCFTPPQTPATPPGVPIPYPNTGMASDTTDGSKTVQISGKEVMLKNKSYFKKSTGDEAGSAPKKGLVTSKIQGKVYFNAWSMDVKFEGENVVRHLDIMTHNHASPTPNTPPWPYADGAAIAPDDPCKKEKKKVQKHCTPEDDWKKNCPTPPPDIGPAPTNKTSAAYAVWQGDNAARLDLFDEFAKKCKENPCIKARKCMLVPKEAKKKGGPQGDCCPGQTGHHLIEGASFTGVSGWGNYDYDAAPTVCAEGPSWHTGSHRELHLYQAAAASNLAPTGKWSRKVATKSGVKAHRKAFPEAGCSNKCLEAQLNKGHDGVCTVSPEPDLHAQINAPKDPDLRGAASAFMNE